MNTYALNDCIYPDCESPSVCEDGYCAHHFWVVQAETLAGFAELQAYLRSWLAYEVWAEQRGVTP